MTDHKVVSQAEWVAARKALLAKEKELTRLRDQISQQRREMPWVRVDKDYVFDGVDGKVTLGDLFAGKNQLIIYHFMFHPDWDEGCKSCSFWADNYDNVIIHLNHRDVAHATISRAPLDKLQAYKQRMGWRFNWVSSHDNDFNYDYGVSFPTESLATPNNNYNFDTSYFGGEEAPGISVFIKDENGDIFHTYSTFSRGLDMLNTAYHHLDLVPKGRDEGDGNMAWLRRHDEYEEVATASCH